MESNIRSIMKNKFKTLYEKIYNCDYRDLDSD